MNPAMYLFVNKGLGMSTGKTAAQVAHAAVEAYKASDPALVEAWELGKHYKKLVMEAEDHEQITNIRNYLVDRGFYPQVVIDEGYTEIRPFSLTALGVPIVDKDEPHVAATFGNFKLYREKPKYPTPDDQWKLYRWIQRELRR